jgi:hypothetical protein
MYLFVGSLDDFSLACASISSREFIASISPHGGGVITKAQDTKVRTKNSSAHHLGVSWNLCDGHAPFWYVPFGTYRCLRGLMNGQFATKSMSACQRPLSAYPETKRIVSILVRLSVAEGSSRRSLTLPGS